MSDIKRTIICMGDGGTDEKNPLLDLYILAQVPKKLPKICFIPTASGDNGGYVKYFHHLFNKYPCKPYDLTLFNPKVADIESYIMDMDIVYVGGGHTKSMLGVWREWGLDKIFQKAYNKGVIMAGGSAGSVCWFNECITDSIPGKLTSMKCLDLLPFSNCPHYRSQERRLSYRHFVYKNKVRAGYAIDDLAGIHFENEQPVRCVSADFESKGYFVSMNGDKFVEQPLDTIWLGDKKNQDNYLWNSVPFKELLESQEEYVDDKIINEEIDQ